MTNPKTTIAGYLAIAIAVLSVAQHWLSGGGFVAGDLQTIINALAGVVGVGLVGASDGGH